MTQIHQSAVIDSEAELAGDVVVGPNCVVKEHATIASGTTLDANVVIGRGVKIGRDNTFSANSVIGGDPQVLGLKNPPGTLEIGDRNVIREQVTINVSMHTGGCTKIGNDNLLMTGVHIGHDCLLQDNIVMSNYCQIGGHCRIEQGAWLSGIASLHQFVTLGKWSYASGMAGINHDIPPFMIVSGHYPPRIRAVNKRGISRAGLSERHCRQICDAYKKLYRSGGVLLENVKALSQQDGLDENVRDIISAIENSSKHRFGRYLELFR